MWQLNDVIDILASIAEFVFDVFSSREKNPDGSHIQTLFSKPE